MTASRMSSDHLTSRQGDPNRVALFFTGPRIGLFRLKPDADRAASRGIASTLPDLKLPIAEQGQVDFLAIMREA